MDKIRFSEGEVIFREGDFGKAMYEIYSGKVRIVSGYDTEDMMDLTELKRGAIFGEMAIIDIYPRSTTAIAKTDVCLIEVPDSKLSEYFNEKPERIMAIMKNLSGRIRALTKDYMEVCETINEAADDGVELMHTEGLLTKLRKFAGIYTKNEKALMRYEERKKGRPDNEVQGFVSFFKKGDIIFKEGDDSLCMYEICRGSVGIYANYGKPDQKLITKLPCEKFFGEMGMIDNEPRSATAVALEDVSLGFIYPDKLAELFNERPAKVMMILQHLTDRLRRLTLDYIRACKTSLEILKAEETGGELEPEASGWVKFFCEVGKYGRYYTITK